MKKEQQSRALVRLERNGHSPALQLEGDVEGTFRGKLDAILKEEEEKRFFLT